MAWALHRRGHPLRVVAARESDPRGVWGALPVAVETAPIPGWPSWLSRYRERREVWLTARLADVALMRMMGGWWRSQLADFGGRTGG